MFRLAIILICSLVTSSARAADFIEADASEVWKRIKASFFADQPIELDVNGSVVTLRTPHRAQDASTVPVTISTRLSQSAGRYVEKLYLIIDKNPSPIAGIFTFTPESGRAEIETRVRVEEYSHMRAIAQLNDGSTFMAVRYIKAAGGCSSPTGTAPDVENFTARVRLRTEDTVKIGESSLAQLMIHHPNTSGLAKDQLTQLFIPAYYVRTVQVTYAGKTILNADVDFSISENPNFRFHFIPTQAGELKATIIDTKERVWEGKVEVIPVPPS